MIPRDILAGNPERTAPTLSPDGTRLAWLAPDKNDVLQVWIKTIGQTDDQMVTTEKKRGIQTYYWANDNRTLLYLQDHDGDENFHLLGADLLSGHHRDFTPFDGTRVSAVILNPDFPDVVLVCLNARDRTVFDVHRLDLQKGQLTLDTQNPGDVSDWITDAQFRVRGACALRPDAGKEVRLRGDNQSSWKTFLQAGPEEILETLDFTADGQSLIDSKVK